MGKNKKQENAMVVHVSQILDKIHAVTVDSYDDYEAAMKFLKDIKDTQAVVTDFFADDIAKRKAALKEVQDEQKKWLDPLKTGDAHVRGKAQHYLRLKREREAREAAEARKREQELISQGADPVAAFEAVAPVKPPEPTRTENGGGIKRWTYKIVDESAIPREYLKIDTAKIHSVVRSMKGDTSIPGVQAYEDISVRVG